jgi:RimJ/RimL family protein N-acetyltransferase
MSILARNKQIINFTDVHIRLAAMSDAVILWQWANDPVTRMNSLNRKPIPWEVHEGWYAKKLTSPDCRVWIMELAKMAIAQIRYDRVSADTAQISLSVAPRMRGRGVGTLILTMTLPMVTRELRVKWVQGIVVTENKASQRAFEKAFFKITKRQLIDNRECLVFQRCA